MTPESVTSSDRVCFAVTMDPLLSRAQVWEKGSRMSAEGARQFQSGQKSCRAVFARRIQSVQQQHASSCTLYIEFHPVPSSQNFKKFRHTYLQIGFATMVPYPIGLVCVVAKRSIVRDPASATANVQLPSSHPRRQLSERRNDHHRSCRGSTTTITNTCLPICL